MDVIKLIEAQQTESVVATEPEGQPKPIRIMVIDAMGVLHSIKKNTQHEDNQGSYGCFCQEN